MTSNIKKSESTSYSLNSIGLQFCEQCDSMLHPKKQGGIVGAYCTECGTFHISETKQFDLDAEEEIVDDIVILEGSEDKQYLLKGTKHCPSCNEKREVEYLAEKSATADDGIQKTYTCLECDHEWTINF